MPPVDPARRPCGLAALTCGPVALTCGPRRPYLRPSRLPCGPVTCCSAGRHLSRPGRLTSPSTRPPRCPAAAWPSRPAPEQPSSRAAQQSSSRAALHPSRLAAEPPSRRAALQPSRPAAEPTCSRAAESPNLRAARAAPSAIEFDVWVDDVQLFLQWDRADGLSLFDLTSGASPAPAADADASVRSQWATRDAAARLAVRRHLPTSELTRLPDSLRVVRDHFLSVCPTTLTVDLLEKSLLAAEKSIVAVGASRGDPRTPIFEGCSPSSLLPSIASAAAADLLGP
ncbi:unnamed protein product [Closterium sp. NIES-64]|nr:unnamed protein product [Closterium sp. NIES-64]